MEKCIERLNFSSFFTISARRSLVHCTHSTFQLLFTHKYRMQYVRLSFSRALCAPTASTFTNLNENVHFFFQRKRIASLSWFQMKRKEKKLCEIDQTTFIRGSTTSNICIFICNCIEISCRIKRQTKILISAYNMFVSTKYIQSFDMLLEKLTSRKTRKKNAGKSLAITLQIFDHSHLLNT